ncbi:helix-turn-helix domain-containing protein [Paenibacillus solisilvae]|uniref:Helix-turn-helix domain-containing protein n=1 Tax=Paenibacillus solisilvae TaxID=2486751 RepID=A0ABW0VUJ1_9BACL
MKNKKWYKRLLLSHFSILFISGAVIIAIVFAVTYNNVSKETEKTNRTYADHVVDGMTASLKNIELMLANLIVNNEAINDYFNGSAYEPKLINYKASSEIAKIRSNPLVHSIYFYRKKDQLVLTGGYAQKLADFTDKQFVQNLKNNPQSVHWSPIRKYSEFPLIDPPERIISITKNSLGNEGIIVLNVKTDLLLSMASKLRSGKRIFMDITDEQGSPIYSTSPSTPKAKPIQYLKSDYIGWNFASGTVSANLIGLAALRSLMPLSVILLTLIVIIAYIMYVTRRNYKPIENIVRRVSSYQQASKAAESDEFSIIEHAFDTMLTRMDLIDRQDAENMLVRRKQFFYELQDDEKVVPMKEWQEYARMFGLPEGRCELFIAILEIDKYVPMLRLDRQELLASKKQLDGAARQWRHSGASVVCSEWISGDRMALLVQIQSDLDVEAHTVNGMMNRLRKWAAGELVFSVTIGIGAASGDLPGIKTSFHEALAALQYKMTAGNNRIIVYQEIKDRENRVDSLYFKWLEDMIHHFRIPAPAWRNDFARIFDHLEERVLKNEEMQLLLNYLMHRFAREMEEISPEINAYWQHVTFSRMIVALKETGSMTEIRLLYESLIGELYDKYVTILESASTSHMIYELKKYIEDNYANSDLSLNHISDRFNINGKYASQLFKEEFGVKFVDFLIGLRVRQAQKLLRETDLSINEISRQVGYEHTISFGRIFKKMVGVSPGDYRKHLFPGRTQEGT